MYPHHWQDQIQNTGVWYVALQQNTVDVFVEFGHPVFKIGISSQVEVNNLIINTSVNYTSHMKRERKNLRQPLGQKFRERFTCIRACRKDLHSMKNILVEVDNVIRLDLKNQDDTSKFLNELYKLIVETILIDEVVPKYVHTVNHRRFLTSLNRVIICGSKFAS